MVHILQFCNECVHHYPASVGSIAGTSLLIPLRIIFTTLKTPREIQRTLNGKVSAGGN